MHRSAMHHPWVTRDDRLMFRGSNLTGNRYLAANVSTTDELDIKVWDWVQEPRHEHFVGLPQHCRNKYLLNWPGNSYSARLKYLLLCSSVVVHSDNGWIEFYYPMLKHGEHYMRVRELNSTADMYSDLPNLVQQLNARPKRSRQIAKAGQRFATETLSVENVREYWFRLVKAYSDLMRYEVVISPDALPLGSSISHPRYVAYANRTGCPEMPDLVADAERAAPMGHFPVQDWPAELVTAAVQPVVAEANQTGPVVADPVAVEPHVVEPTLFGQTAEEVPVVHEQAVTEQLDQPEVIDTVVPELNEQREANVQHESESLLDTIAF